MRKPPINIKDIFLDNFAMVISKYTSERKNIEPLLILINLSERRLQPYTQSLSCCSAKMAKRINFLKLQVGSAKSPHPAQVTLQCKAYTPLKTYQFLKLQVGSGKSPDQAQET